MNHPRRLFEGGGREKEDDVLRTKEKEPSYWNHNPEGSLEKRQNSHPAASYSHGTVHDTSVWSINGEGSFFLRTFPCLNVL